LNPLPFFAVTLVVSWLEETNVVELRVNPLPEIVTVAPL
jgi:hypothetical protein